jgi:uncharacterized membrane protein YvlD (DUF360 family)
MGIIRTILLSSLIFFLLTILFPQGVSAVDVPKDVLLAGILWWLLVTFLRPFVTLLATPLFLLNSTIVSWLISTALLWILTLIHQGLRINAFATPRIEISGFVVPSLFLSPIFAFLFVSAAFSVLQWLLRWITSE